jgi:hypothetical protein
VHLSLKFAKVQISLQFFFEVGGELVRQTVLVILFETLEIFDVALVTLLVSERSLTIDRRAVAT